MSNPAEYLKKVEYRIKPITRYVITRYEEGHDESIEDGPNQWSGSTEKGMYDNADTAWEVGYALCQTEHFALGWPVGDERIQYPRHPDSEGSAKTA